MIVHKYVVHVLDKSSDVPLLNDYEGKISQEVDKFISGLIKKVVKDDDLRKAVYKNYDENILNRCCEQIIYNEDTFLENSKEIASYLFNVMSTNADMESCDLLICTYTIKDERYVGIMKLDYKKLFTHHIEFEGDKFNINLMKNEIGIPETQKPKQCIIGYACGKNDEWQLRVLDKIGAKDSIETSFVKEFAQAELVEDDKYKTKVLKNKAETWITNGLSNNIKKAEDARSVLNYMLKEKEEVDVQELSRDIFDNVDIADEFVQALEDEGVSGEIVLDKKWVEKNLKKRSIKTDTGFDIKGDLSNFDDPMKYSVKQNPDGSIDITLKNLKYIEEK